MAEGRSRSDETRERIAQAAHTLFAEDGYERTTIRSVASKAKIDPALVMRYYGSKEGLFAAVSTFDLQLPDLSTVPREEIGERIVRHFLARWQRSGDEGLILLLRTAASNENACAKMREIFKGQVLPLVAGLVEDEREASLRAELLGSQILGLAFCRFVLKLPNLSDEDTAPIVENAGAAIQMYLTGKV
jgi:AcrR family transcriptional regulator